jgi:hypothetical protein
LSEIINELKRVRPANIVRMTYSLNVHHQLPGENPKPFRVNGDKVLVVEEQPYERTVTIDKETDLDFGWIEPSQMKMIILYNITGKSRNTIPNDEERESDASAVLVMDHFKGIVVPPGDAPTVIHVDETFNGVRIRSLGSPARLHYFGIPK